jgi:hypothetical protein
MPAQCTWREQEEKQARREGSLHNLRGEQAVTRVGRETLDHRRGTPKAVERA